MSHRPYFSMGSMLLHQLIQPFRKRYVALKVCVADADPQHELEIYSRLPRAEGRHVVELLDSFSLQGPNGVHAVRVHSILSNLSEAIHSFHGARQVKRICRQLVEGVAFMHRHGVVHGGKVHTTIVCTDLICTFLCRSPSRKCRNSSSYSEGSFSARHHGPPR